MTNIKIGLAQIHSRLGDVKRNLEKHIRYIEKAKKLEIDILAFPELSLTGYMLKDLAFELSESCKEALEELEEISEDICVLVGFVEEYRKGIYRNSIAVIRDGEQVGVIPKIYLPSYGLFEEHRYFKEGNPKEYKVFRWRGFTFSSVICEDAWHPEPIELMAKLGADLVFIHSSSPIRGLYGSGETLIERVWESIVVTRAVENTVFTAFVNRIGVEDEEYFWGGSMVSTPIGEVIARGSKTKEQLVVVSIDDLLLRLARRYSSFKTHNRLIHKILGEFS